MEASSTGQQSLREMTMKEGEVFCKVGEGWICTITRTETAKAGTPFSKCAGSSCTCVTNTKVDQISNMQDTLESAKVFCKVGEGWTCVVTKSEGPDAGKTYFECGEGCVCVIDETDAVKTAYA